MLEFLALFYLVKKNRENALAKGRKPGGFIALTFILWFHFELAGFIFGIVRLVVGWLLIVEIIILLKIAH